jgi:glycosyltransferase involved in cell wall biosynthesis
MSPDLTIAVPTYNRPDKANRLICCVLELGAEYSNRLLVSIADNCTDSGVVASSYPNSSITVKYTRRVINIGGVANVLRVIEEAETEWLSIVSDDDDINSDGIRIMLSDISRASADVIAFKYKSELDLSQIRDETLDSLPVFLQRISEPAAFGSMLLISTWLFRVSKIKKYIRYSQIYAGLQMPHVCTVLFALKDKKGIVILRNSQPVKYKQASKGDTWDYSLTYSLMLSTVSVAHFFDDREMVRTLLSSIIGKSFKTIIGFHLRVYDPENNIKNRLNWSIIRSVSFKHLFVNLVFRLLYWLIPQSVYRQAKGVFGKNGLDRM